MKMPDQALRLEPQNAQQRSRPQPGPAPQRTRRKKKKETKSWQNSRYVGEVTGRGSLPFPSEMLLCLSQIPQLEKAGEEPRAL